MTVDESSEQARHGPVWFDDTGETAYDSLAGDLTVDTAVVGGGIVGASVAFELTEAGQSVALLERDHVVRGVTGHTTAKLTAQHGRLYQYLQETFGRKHARQYAAANQSAIDTVESRINRLGVDCHFERAPAYVYTQSPSEREAYRAEADAARDVALPATYTETVPDPLSAVAAVRFDDQALFHPRKYLLALVEQVAAAGNHVFEESPVTDVDPGAPCEVTTGNGTVRADDVVVATHFPIYDRGLYFARVYPKQSYVLAARLAGDPPEGMFYRPGDSYFSVRPRPAGDDSVVLIGGENHRTGHGGDTERRYRRLETAARRQFDIEAVTNRWATQDFVSVDRVPLVGHHSPVSDHLYVATGFGGWGLTNGTAAGRILADLVLDRGNPWREMYRPTRRPRLTALSSLAAHGREATKHAVLDRLEPAPRPEDVSLGRDDATVVRADDEPVAVYRDSDGEIHAVSAVCTHQGCHVRWNDTERTWDCPCHGSRFGYDGRVVDTPAIADLAPHDYSALDFDR